MFAQGVRAIAEKKLDAAEAVLDALARMHEPTVDEWLLRAELLRLRDRQDESIAALSHVPDSDPRCASARLTAGSLELIQDRRKAADAAFRSALELDPRLDHARRERLRIAQLLGSRRETEALLDELSRSSATGLTFEEAFFWTVGTMLESGPAEAVSVLQRWIQAEPDDDEAKLALSRALRALGRLEKAEETIEGLDDGRPEVVAERAQILIERGDADGARRLLAGRAEPAVSALRGRLALLSGEAREAVGPLREGLAANPGDRQLRFDLAQALRLAGRPDEAAPLLAEANAWNELERKARQAQVPGRREDPKTMVDLAESCLRLGRRGPARAWYRLALAKDPTNTAVQRALFALRD